MIISNLLPFFVLLFLFYAWFAASSMITYLCAEVNYLNGWEKVVIFFGWPFLSIVFFYDIIWAWLKERK